MGLRDRELIGDYRVNGCAFDCGTECYGNNSCTIRILVDEVLYQKRKADRNYILAKSPEERKLWARISFIVSSVLRFVDVEESSE